MIERAGNWILAARPRTLWAAVSPVIIGIAMAYRDDAMHPLAAVLTLLSAVLIQIGTNFHNDYSDFLKGADAQDRKGPVRAVQSGLLRAESVRRATVLTFSLAVVAGAYLMWRGGLPIVAIGVASILFGVLYTGGRYSLSYLGLADGFVFVFFGPVAVAGTYYVQALTWPAQVWIAGIAPGLLSIAILMVNNIRDIDEDRAAGKRTIVVRLGRRFGVATYAGCIVLAAGIPFVLHFQYGGPLAAVSAAIILPVSLPLIHQLKTTPVNEGARLNAVLGSTARLVLIYSLCFSLGWVYSG